MYGKRSTSTPTYSTPNQHPQMYPTISIHSHFERYFSYAGWNLSESATFAGSCSMPRFVLTTFGI